MCSIECAGGTTVLNTQVLGGVSYSPATVLVNGSPIGSSYRMYTITAIDAKGCSASTYFNITEPAPISLSHTTTACENYLWHGTVYSVSGNYTYLVTNLNGCAETHILNLTINNKSYSNTSITACNAYTWMNGITYSNSGTYQHTISNVQGCDSVMSLTLFLNNGISIAAKAFLSGAYIRSVGLMKDSLRRVRHYENVTSSGNPNYPCTYGVPMVGPPMNVIPQVRQNFALHYAVCDGDTLISPSVFVKR